MSKFVTGMLVGAVLGAGIALLTAPHSGRSTRTRLVRVVRRSQDGDGDENLEREQIMAELKRRRRKARR